jgi:hypothetical protein
MQKPDYLSKTEKRVKTNLLYGSAILIFAAILYYVFMLF